jgi:hypothetical protein
MSTTQLGARIGAGEAYIRHLETERHVPSPENCAALAEALALDEDDRLELFRAVDAGYRLQLARQFEQRYTNRREQLQRALGLPAAGR